MAYKKLSEEEKQARKLERKKEKEAAEILMKINDAKNQPLVKSILITVEWKRSRTWGHNPNAYAEVQFADGCYEMKEGYTASGCGYDKESTVIAAIFNDFLKYKLWEKNESQLNRKDYLWREEDGAPYGISANKFITNLGNNVESRHYSGGIGTNCYCAISEYIGGKFKRVATGKTFDVYEYTDGKE